MKRTRLASRYAKALFEFAEEQHQLEEISKDMLLVDDTFDNSPELRYTFNSPIVKTDKKAAILKALFADRISEPAFRYLMLILRKGRELQLDTICSEYVKIYKAKKNIITLDVYSAQPVGKEAMERLKSKVAGETKANIEVVEHLSPELIGGIIIKYEDYMLDASILHSINEMKRKLIDNTYQISF